MTRGYRLAVWITCAALLSIGASHARGDDKKNGSQKSKLKGTYTFRLVPATSRRGRRAAAGHSPRGRVHR
jgi:hypothetical protein